MEHAVVIYLNQKTHTYTPVTELEEPWNYTNILWMKKYTGQETL